MSSTCTSPCLISVPRGRPTLQRRKKGFATNKCIYVSSKALWGDIATALTESATLWMAAAKYDRVIGQHRERVAPLLPLCSCFGGCEYEVPHSSCEDAPLAPSPTLVARLGGVWRGGRNHAGQIDFRQVIFLRRHLRIKLQLHVLFLFELDYSQCLVDLSGQRQIQLTVCSVHALSPSCFFRLFAFQ